MDADLKKNQPTIYGYTNNTTTTGVTMESLLRAAEQLTRIASPPPLHAIIATPAGLVKLREACAEPVTARPPSPFAGGLGRPFGSVDVIERDTLAAALELARDMIDEGKSFIVVDEKQVLMSAALADAVRGIPLALRADVAVKRGRCDG